LKDILSLDATDQLRALDAHRISARELLRASVARTDQLNPKLNAVVSRDLGRAYASAELIDNRRARGESLGRLAGLPMTVKDALDVEGLPASAGIESLLHRTATDAVVVSRVKTADAIVWGKTNTPVKAADWQTYNALYGTSNNPWDLERTPGGSSGGAAAGVAAGLTALEIGADIAGSLRVPASFCGVFAHKPTYGIVSQRGFVPLLGFPVELDLAVVGPMARSARDLRLLLSIIADAPVPVEAPPIELKRLKVALWLEEPTFALDTEVKTIITTFAQKLEGAGAIVEPMRCPVDPEALMFAYTTLLFALTGAGLPSIQRHIYEILRGPARMMRAMGAKPLSWAQGILAHTARHREWLQANEARAQMAEVMEKFFARYDVLLAPVCPIPAFPHDHRPFLVRKLTCSDGRRIAYLEMLDWIALATVCGLPVTVVPAGLTSQRLPVGAQIIGLRGSDSRALAVAQAIDEQIGGFRAPPLELA
jgi:amidase